MLFVVSDCCGSNREWRGDQVRLPSRDIGTCATSADRRFPSDSSLDCSGPSESFGASPPDELFPSPLSWSDLQGYLRNRPVHFSRIIIRSVFPLRGRFPCVRIVFIFGKTSKSYRPWSYLSYLNSTYHLSWRNKYNMLSQATIHPFF
jgi:hypothetical protein